MRNDFVSNLSRKACAAAALALALTSVSAGFGLAQSSYPSRPVSLIVGYPPGSSSDTLARAIGEKMAASMGQPVVVESKSGGSGNLGTGFVARSAPDGYTLLLSTDNPITTNVHLFKELGFDPIKDFTPISIAASNVIVVVGAPNFPPNTLQEVIAYAKANPGKVTFATSGIGSPHHLIGESIKTKSGTDIVHAPYRGGGPALADVLGGHVPMGIVSLSAALPYIGTDKLKIYAISEPERYPSIPNIPTIAETFPGFFLKSWLGFMVPAATPADIVAKLNKEVIKALKDPEVVKRLTAMGLTPVGNSVDEAKKMIAEDLKIRGDIVKAANLPRQ
ncbi:tripartite tricarboxylate transporter substrate binding protein [Pseudorhodoplanes sp.]|uniref:Bug family tripartite tricarboxylate transporter substrate binding protein n=1 Tax=Pseudorhodoplanes sp. TaxID=1934341 RepID=UPI002C05D4D4|nr:tripartite tricarboxylate transporter substrate binding protein [Pseudorhodoplanes sp.]HWV51039.1 tripartite tricarboxylate transporter substrate binding protein [Pseudorhodoplanes sp.]